MTKQCNSKTRCTVRMTPYQHQVIRDLSESLNTSQSVLLRAIIGDWITAHEDYLDRVLNDEENNDEIMDDYDD